MGKITSTRFATKDDPIYSGSSQLSFHNRSKKSTTDTQKSSDGASPEMSKKDSSKPATKPDM